MSIFREIPPTAGFPLYLKDLLSPLKTSPEDDFLEDDFRQFLDVGYARIICSGTAAFFELPAYVIHKTGIE